MVCTLLYLLLLLPCTQSWINENKRIEDDLLKTYDRRHRPVKKESTTMLVQVYLMINHIEKVDEHEQTMLLHGILWASWFDEYLQWNPNEYNRTSIISIEAYKLWQPTFALYNSARSNGWFVYMNGVPATVSSAGRVFAAGTFSFHVTCQFDFSDYPYDEQECPIVLADWMYDLSKVNLSDPISANAKPTIRLSFDPLSETSKRHVAGWELLDSWQKHCYWGPKGCTDDMPIGLLDNYWSLLEFGVKIKRHAPYYGLTMVLPTLITALITLLVFWIEDLSLAIFLAVLNVLLQSFSGWALIQQLPPGNGQLPKIANLYAWNVLMTVVAFVLHTVFQYLLYVLPEDIEFPLKNKVKEVTDVLRSSRFFQVQGLSFDPQALNFASGTGDKESSSNNIAYHHHFTNPHEKGSPSGSSLVLEMESIVEGEQQRGEKSIFTLSKDIIAGSSTTAQAAESARRNASPTTSSSLDTIVELDLENPATQGDFGRENESLISHSFKNKKAKIEVPSRDESKDSQTNTFNHLDPSSENKASKKSSQLEQELYVMRRIVFALFLCMFIVLMPFLLF